MRIFREREFDIVFSNSVIEHVGKYEQQAQMAKEVLRVGRRYFLQTPNRFFPIEPHFVFPLFQFLPVFLRIWLVSHFDLGWHKKASDTQEAVALANSIRLLTRRELKELFPGGTVYREKFYGLTKSFIIYGDSV
jgi:2-polyprenyl-3-methyl-5-hydroxy-6-metoxy-1,4-benzoquinol methylase